MVDEASVRRRHVSVLRINWALVVLYNARWASTPRLYSHWRYNCIRNAGQGNRPFYKDPLQRDRYTVAAKWCTGDALQIRWATIAR